MRNRILFVALVLILGGCAAPDATLKTVTLKIPKVQTETDVSR